MLAKTKVIQGDEVIGPLNDLEDEINHDFKLAANMKTNIAFLIPLVQFDRSCYSAITSIGVTSKGFLHKITVIKILYRIHKSSYLLFWRKK